MVPPRAERRAQGGAPSGAPCSARATSTGPSCQSCTGQRGLRTAAPATMRDTQPERHLQRPSSRFIPARNCPETACLTAGNRFCNHPRNPPLSPTSASLPPRPSQLRRHRTLPALERVRELLLNDPNFKPQRVKPLSSGAFKLCTFICALNEADAALTDLRDQLRPPARWVDADGQLRAHEAKLAIIGPLQVTAPRAPSARCAPGLEHPPRWHSRSCGSKASSRPNTPPHPKKPSVSRGEGGGVSGRGLLSNVKNGRRSPPPPPKGSIRMAVHRRRRRRGGGRQSDHHGKRRNVPVEKSRAIFGAQTFGSQTLPPPPPAFLCPPPPGLTNDSSEGKIKFCKRKDTFGPQTLCSQTPPPSSPSPSKTRLSGHTSAQKVGFSTQGVEPPALGPPRTTSLVLRSTGRPSRTHAFPPQEKCTELEGEIAVLQCDADISGTRAHFFGARVKPLQDDRGAWRAALPELRARLACLAGDSLLAAAFVTYAGPLGPKARQQLLDAWVPLLEAQTLTPSRPFSLLDALGARARVCGWGAAEPHGRARAAQESAAVAAHSAAHGRWCLLLDPHGAGAAWVAHAHGAGLRVLRPGAKRFVNALMQAVQDVAPVLVEGVVGPEPLLVPLLKARVELAGEAPEGGGGNCRVELDAQYTVTVPAGFRMCVTTREAQCPAAWDMPHCLNVVNFVMPEEDLQELLLSVGAVHTAPLPPPLQGTF